MRNRITERLQFLIRDIQLRGAFGNPLFQFRIEPPHLLFRPFALTDFHFQQRVRPVGGVGQFMLAHRAERQRFVHRAHLFLKRICLALLRDRC